MANNTAMNRDNLILNNVEEDMDVYDSNKDKVGEVDFIHFGEGHEAADTESNITNPDMLTEIIRDIFTADNDLPDELRGRLERHGFARVKGLMKTFFIIPENIKSIEDNIVRLNVPKDQLISY